MRTTTLLDENLRFLPHRITHEQDLAAAFSELFNSPEAKQAKNVVYCFVSEHPIPRVQGHSRILYIGMTTTSLHARYARYSTHLSLGPSGAFYRYVLANYGAIQLGYRQVDDPKLEEHLCIKSYVDMHLENPPKARARPRRKADKK